MTEQQQQQQMTQLRRLLRHNSSQELAKHLPGCLANSCSRGSCEAVKLLLDEAKTSPNLPLQATYCGSVTSATPLHVACAFGQLEVAELLLDRSADVNSVDSDGQTPLHLVVQVLPQASPPVAEASRLKLAELLLLRGADPDRKHGATGVTPRDIVQHSDCSQELRQLLQLYTEPEGRKSKIGSADTGRAGQQELPQQSGDSQHIVQTDVAEALAEVLGMQIEPEQTKTKHPVIKLPPAAPPVHPNIHQEPLEVFEYPMGRGLCAIFNNVTYANSARFAPRIGADVDVQNVRTTFEKMDFEVWDFVDLTAHDINKILTSIGNSSLLPNGTQVNLRQYARFFCFLMGHGSPGVVYGTDGQEFKVASLWSIFSNDTCHELAGKAKCFFLQACRGREVQKNAFICYDGQATQEVEHDTERKVIPSRADFLFSYATTLDHVAFRGTDGSLYIKKLCAVLNQLQSSRSLGDILTTVHYHVSKLLFVDIYGEEYFMTPEVQHTLRGVVYVEVNKGKRRVRFDDGATYSAQLREAT